MPKDRRRAERLDANLFAEIETLTGNRIGRGVVVDVSLSGFAVETEADLPINSEVVCHVEVPLKLRATVVRSISASPIKRFGLRLSGQSFWDKIVFRRVLKGQRRTRKVE